LFQEREQLMSNPYLTEDDRAESIRIMEGYVEPWAVEYVEPAVRGDVDAAESLSAAAGNENRGRLAVHLLQAGTPKEAYRVFLSAAWDHDHHHVRNCAGSILESMFTYAAFPLPDSLPKVVTAWRGTSGISREKACRGISWTIDRDVACFFAMRPRGEVENPLVLKCKVPRTSIMFYSNEREEREVLFFRGGIGIVVDGTPDDWKRGYRRKVVQAEQNFEDLKRWASEHATS
jgi:hypothetical protein